MHLVDDEYRVATNLWQHSHLLDKVADILYRVVRCGIELVDIERAILVERETRVALIARLGTYGVHTVYCLSEYSRTSGFTHTARSAKEVGVSQLTTLDSIFQCRGDMILTNHTCKCGRTILSSRYDKLLHKRHKVNKLCLFLVNFQTKCRTLVTFFAIYATLHDKTALLLHLAEDLLRQKLEHKTKKV